MRARVNGVGGPCTRLVHNLCKQPYATGIPVGRRCSGPMSDVGQRSCTSRTGACCCVREVIGGGRGLLGMRARVQWRGCGRDGDGIWAGGDRAGIAAARLRLACSPFALSAYEDSDKSEEYCA